MVPFEVTLVSSSDWVLLAVKFVQDGLGEGLAVTVPTSWQSVPIDPEAPFEVPSFFKMLLLNR